MQINEYQQLALRTEAKTESPNLRLLQGLMGLCGESGECLEILKKHMFHGHWLDIQHIANELGDVAWYLAISANAIGFTLEEIMQRNVDKLEKRYPDGFDTEHSVHRKEGDI